MISGRLLAVLFLLMATPIVISNVYMMPPFQGADEVQHFLRVAHISRGHLVGSQVIVDNALTAGGYVDRSASEVSGVFAHIMFRPEVKLDPNLVHTYRAVTWSWPDAVAASFSGSVVYPPLLYLPSVAGLKLAQSLGASIFDSLTMARLASALACLAIAFVALRMVPFGRAVMFAVLILPMSLSLMGILGQDGIFIALTALLVSLVATDKQGNWSRYVAAAVIGIIVAAKIAFFPLFLLLFLRYFRPAVSGQYAAFWVIPLAIVVPWMIWGFLPVRVPFRADSGVDTGLQLRFLLTNPTLWPEIAFNTFSQNGSLYYRSFIGILGWLDVDLPRHTYRLYGVVLLIALAIDFAVGRNHLTTKDRLLVVAAILLSSASIFATMYLGWTRVGTLAVEGVQGRYFIPLALLLCLAVPREKAVDISPRAAAFVLPSLALLSIYSFWVVPRAIMMRYWG